MPVGHRNVGSPRNFVKHVMNAEGGSQFLGMAMDPTLAPRRDNGGDRNSQRLGSRLCAGVPLDRHHQQLRGSVLHEELELVNSVAGVQRCCDHSPGSGAQKRHRELDLRVGNAGVGAGFICWCKAQQGRTGMLIDRNMTSTIEPAHDLVALDNVTSLHETE